MHIGVRYAKHMASPTARRYSGSFTSSNAARPFLDRNGLGRVRMHASESLSHAGATCEDGEEVNDVLIFGVEVVVVEVDIVAVVG
jgi:hypothetical protein